MPEWEYRKINLNDVPLKIDEIDLLNDAGKHGWELVGITTHNVAYLKRQLEAIAPAQEAPAPARATRRKAATTAK